MVKGTYFDSGIQAGTRLLWMGGTAGQHSSAQEDAVDGVVAMESKDDACDAHEVASSVSPSCDTETGDNDKPGMSMGKVTGERLGWMGRGMTGMVSHECVILVAECVQIVPAEE